jgi:murein DD-endopeptidase MepM/ murein hydrolase activator NlpD
LARKRDKQPVTLLIVPPHPERSPVSLRFPTWALPLFLLSVLSLFLVLGYVVDSRTNLERELAQYKRIVDLESSRQEEMRNTILAQQEEVKRLADQTTQFQTDLSRVDELADQVRQMMGLVTPTPPITPTATVTPDNTSAVGGQGSAALAAAPSSPERTTSSRGDRPTMGLVGEDATLLSAMENTLPIRSQTLTDLMAEAEKRLQRIDPEKRTTKEQLEQQLQLLAAAPHALPLEGNPRIVSGFGYRTLNGVREFHTGIDLSVWYGNPVMATADGTVKFAGWLGGYGWAVEIEHTMGFSTVYGHNSRLLVKAGAEVKTGDVIALSGSTGNSTGPHVHYEIRLNDKAVDPMTYIGLDEAQ